MYVYESDHRDDRKCSFSQHTPSAFIPLSPLFPFCYQVSVRGAVALTLLLSPQAAQSVNKALEQFVKPEQLDGENSYKCSKYVVCAAGPDSR